MRRAWRPLRGGSSCAALMLLLTGCGAADPVVHLQVVPGPDVETLERFVRLSLEVNRCEGLGVLYREDVPFMDGVEGPRLALPLLPGKAFSLWLTAYGTCTATIGDSVSCKNYPDKTPPRQALKAEGCSDWIVITEGERTVPITLTATAGLCPAPRARCPT